MGKPGNYLWVLNPDVERELGAKHSYAVRAAFMKRMAERRPLFEGLVQGEAMQFVYELSPCKEPTQALFWSPTPRAREAAAACGLSFGAAPSLEVLRKVNDKGFLTTSLPELTLPGRNIVSTEEEWRQLRASRRGPLRLKRPYGYAGKGQRIWPEIGGEDRSWLVDSLRLGKFIAEPQITGATELSQHGFIDAEGMLLGRPCLLKTDAASAPVSIEPAFALQNALAAELGRLATKVAERLLQTGYFGPFGIDVLVTQDHPYVIDLNPRFTLGWSIGMGKERSRAIERALNPRAP